MFVKRLVDTDENNLHETSKWVIADKHKLSNVSAISWREQFYIQWNDDDVRFVLHQHT
jgi:hypothetical protein